MRELVRVRQRLSRDGKRFTYMLDFVDQDGKRRRVSVGHGDRRKAERQRAQKEAELRMGVVEPSSMKLSQLLQGHLTRMRGQVRESTLIQQDISMRHLISVVGDMDLQKVKHEHGEYFVQARLDKGRAAATVNKEVRAIHRILQLAMQRRQLESNPFQWLRKPKSPRRKVRVYSDEECDRLLRAAVQVGLKKGFDWQLFIAVALCTGMRRGELLNMTWRDVDFEKEIVEVSPKKDTEHTWSWQIKDVDRRTLPLTEDVLALLVNRQESATEGNPYVFIPDWRFDRIQQRRRKGTWSVEDGKCPVNNFPRDFGLILECASVEHGECHDLRRTCLSRWLRQGLSEYEVMQLAGHADFQTTHRFYLAIRDDVLDRARAASTAAMGSNFGARLARATTKGDENRVFDYPRCDSNAQPLAPEANALSN